LLDELRLFCKKMVIKSITTGAERVTTEGENMKHISDEQLVEELKFRLEQSSKSLYDLSVVNRKLIEMNHRLEESETLKSNFLSNIRNEIVDPLNAIIGLTSQLAELVKKPEISGVVAMILSEALNLDFQLRNIFMAAELEAGEAVPTIEHVEVSSVVSGILEGFSAHARDKQVSLRFNLLGADQEGKLWFSSDAQKMQVIVANLVANAIEFSAVGKEVLVLVEKVENKLVIQVQDQGVGIAEGNLNTIFNRFVQLDTGATRAHHGHGLGLSIVKSLLDLLQGDIQVSSQVGIGSLFKITLPESCSDSDDMVFSEGGNLFIFDTMDEK
jgi:signal transduction histidine kinase